MSGLPLLSLLVAIPLVAGVLCLFVSDNGARWTALIATLIDFALSLGLWARFNPDGAQCSRISASVKTASRSGETADFGSNFRLPTPMRYSAAALGGTPSSIGRLAATV